jgi:DNA-binding NtrC family response regulator
MSGERDPQKEAEAMIEGAFGYLDKPFDLRALDRLIARAIASVDPGGAEGEVRA